MDKKEINNMVNSMMVMHKKEQDKEFQNLKDELKDIKKLLANLLPNKDIRITPTPDSMSASQRDWERGRLAISWSYDVNKMWV